MERDKGRHFSEEFKRWSVMALESGEITKDGLKAQYGITGHTTILKWCRLYGKKEYPLRSLEKGLDTQISREERTLQGLRNQVTILERELKDSRLRQATLETLVDVAEKHYSIRIKKNCGGKRLSK